MLGFCNEGQVSIRTTKLHPLLRVDREVILETKVAVLALLLACWETLGQCLSLPSASLKVPVSSWAKARVTCGHSQDQQGTQAGTLSRCWDLTLCTSGSSLAKWHLIATLQAVRMSSID